MFGMGAQELMVILVIVLVLFGGSKLPDLAKSLGKSMKEFKKGIASEPDDEPAAKPPAAAATPAPSRTCGGCKSPLEPGWTHCPRCGAAAPPAPPA
jgi:sec-independent protein translocase protein TatA